MSVMLDFLESRVSFLFEIRSRAVIALRWESCFFKVSVLTRTTLFYFHVRLCFGLMVAFVSAHEVNQPHFDLEQTIFRIVLRAILTAVCSCRFISIVVFIVILAVLLKVYL